LQLQLAQPLTRGTYSFAVHVDLPPETPSVNTFNLIIQDQYGNVVDAAYAVAGQPLVNVGAEQPTLQWSRADAGQPTLVTIGINFTRATPGLQALLVLFPDTFQHDVQISIDVQNLNNRFPLVAGNNWADVSKKDRIKIMMDDSQANIIPADTYRFSFPVLMPPDVPRVNLWFLCLCTNLACDSLDDERVMVTFPVAGFNIGQTSTGSGGGASSPQQSIAGLARQGAPLGLGGCLLLLLATLLLSSS